MARRLETFCLCICICLGAAYWFHEVRQNDNKLERVARCADAAGTPNGVEWRAAWDACWRAYDGTP